jgi:hypothetical protein
VVTVVLESDKEVTKEDAIASLGDNASKYVVQTWEAKEE